MTRRPLVLLIGVLLLPATAGALPRFAARNGSECGQCHVNPSGGGMRNEYGRSVFEHTMLPSFSLPQAGEQPLMAAPFTGDVTEWLAIGADLRAAYIQIRPDKGPVPGTPPLVTNSFFLMQASLYHAATLGEHLVMMIDVGIYSGFQAWGLLRLNAEPKNFDLMLKVGRFMPAFGLREVEHQLFTREGIGLGNADRDTGLELTMIAGRHTLQLGLVNGTLGDAAFDSAGTSRRLFEKAVVARGTVRAALGRLRGQLGASFYYNNDIAQANPLFGQSLPTDLAAGARLGLDEFRGGGFLTLNLGRLTWLGEVAVVHDRFYDGKIPSLSGYAAYQELSLVTVKGLDLVATFEFKDPDLEVLGDASYRVGFAVELFPIPYLELRAMLRRLQSPRAPSGGEWDFVLFAHLFF